MTSRRALEGPPGSLTQRHWLRAQRVARAARGRRRAPRSWRPTTAATTSSVSHRSGPNPLVPWQTQSGAALRAGASCGGGSNLCCCGYPLQPSHARFRGVGLRVRPSRGRYNTAEPSAGVSNHSVLCLTHGMLLAVRSFGRMWTYLISTASTRRRCTRRRRSPPATPSGPPTRGSTCATTAPTARGEA